MSSVVNENENEGSSSETLSQISPQSSPKDIESSPKDIEVSPKDSEVSPKDSEVSPKDSEVSPKDIEVSPKDSEVSPTEDGVSSKSSPKESGSKRHRDESMLILANQGVRVENNCRKAKRLRQEATKAVEAESTKQELLQDLLRIGRARVENLETLEVDELCDEAVIQEYRARRHMRCWFKKKVKQGKLREEDYAAYFAAWLAKRLELAEEQLSDFYRS